MELALNNYFDSNLQQGKLFRLIDELGIEH